MKNFIIAISLLVAAMNSAQAQINAGHIQWSCHGSNLYSFQVKLVVPCGGQASPADIYLQGCDTTHRVSMCLESIAPLGTDCGSCREVFTFSTGQIALPCQDVWNITYVAQEQRVTGFLNIQGGYAGMTLRAQVNSAVCHDSPSPADAPLLCADQPGGFTYVSSGAQLTHSLQSIVSSNFDGGQQSIPCMTPPPQEKFFEVDIPFMCGASTHAVMEESLMEADRSGLRDGGYVIPVVVHIIHDGGPENITDAQVHDAITHLNADFNKTNSVWPLTHPAFLPIVADVGIEFRLATLDPNGNPHGGITRTQSPHAYTMGHETRLQTAWPRSRYMNIWVCICIGNCEGSPAGTATMPFYAAEPFNAPYDGITILHNYIGSIGTSHPMRTQVLAHEVGHFLNLHHTWGPGNGVGQEMNCNFDDFVSDTPNTIGQYGCPDVNAETCGSLDNVENFMNYSYCSKMFTEGQKTRMIVALNSTVAERSNLWQESNLLLTGVIEPVEPPQLPLVCNCLSNFTAQDPSAPGTVQYTQGYSFDSAPQGFSLTGGEMSFTPLIGSYGVNIRTDIYVGGEWAGYISHDMDLRGVDCTNQAPQLISPIEVTSGFVDGNDIYVMTYHPFCINFNVEDPEWDAISFTGGLTMSFTGDNPLVISACSDGLPPGEHPMVFEFTDDNCMQSATLSIPLNIVSQIITDVPEVVLMNDVWVIDGKFDNWVLVDNLGRLILTGRTRVVDTRGVSQGIYLLSTHHGDGVFSKKISVP